MKAMKLALIGTAALAAVSVSARADDLSNLKAQIETLNARMASLEASPAVPAGFQAVSFTRNEAGEHVISIMPTADAPAAATITWSGYVRAGVQTGRDVGGVLTTNTNKTNQYATDIIARGGLKVVGTTDTAVGEVGVSIAFRTTGVNGGDQFHNGQSTAGGFIRNGGNAGLNTDGYYGWWKMTPNLTLKGGVFGSLSKNSYSFDAQCTCAYNDYYGAVNYSGRGPGDPAQVQIAYADGPLGLAIAVEDGDNRNNSDDSAFGVTAKATYAADIFGVDLSGGYWGTTQLGAEAAYVIDGGIGAKLGIFSIGAAVGFGSGFGLNDNYTKASGYAVASLTDAAGIELGVTHQWDGAGPLADATEFDAALYYTPVSQLKIGVEGMYISGGVGDGAYVGALYSKFSF